MRTRILMMGGFLIVIGLVLSFLPFIQTISQNVTGNTPAEYNGYQADTWNISGFSITGEIPISLSWTAGSSVRTLIEVCTGGGFNPYFICLGKPSWPGNGSGTSGSASFSVKSGATLMVSMYSQNETSGRVTGEVAQSTVGTICVAVGAVLVVLGLVLRRGHEKGPSVSDSQPVKD